MQIRRYTHEDYPKVLELIRAVYNEQACIKATQRFQWQYEQNPGKTTQDPLIFLLEDDGKIIGMVGAFAQRLKIGDFIYPAYWIGDFMVHPESRRGFHAVNLVKMFSKLPYLVMGFPVEYSIKLWLRSGGIQFSQLVRYSRKIQSSSQKKLNMVDRLGDFLNYRVLKGAKIVEVRHFDERFDRLWEKASKNYQAIQVRDRLFLNWRFFQCPYISYRILTAIKKNEVLGYIVLREKNDDGVREGSIVDLFIDRSDKNAAAILMEEGIKVLKNSGCDAIRMTVSSEDNFLINILNQFSFFDSERIDRGLFYNNTNSDLNSIIQESSNWFLTRADSDMDFSE